MKVTLVQLNYIVGDYAYNFSKIKKAIIQNASSSDLLIFSELALSGYYPFDLLERPEFVQRQAAYLERVKYLTKQYQCRVLIGAFVSNFQAGKPLFNGALLIDRGETVFTYHKHLLPVYNIHDEPRHFERGVTTPVFTIADHKYGVLNCEDIWSHFQNDYFEIPAKKLENQGIEALFVINSSPSSIAKVDTRSEIVSNLACQLQTPVVYVNQVGGNDEIVYDGSSFIADAYGIIRHRSASFESSVETVDLNRLDHQPAYPLKGTLSRQYCILEQLKLGLKDYIHKCGFKQVVVGLSGGIDSALTLTLACFALGKQNCFAITMPSIYSSSGSRDDSDILCQQLGVSLSTRTIINEFELACQNFKEAFGENPSQITQENMQSRIRGSIIMAFSNHYNTLALATGNKSEMAVGYATLYGDMNGALNILGDLYKQDVYALARYINRVYGPTIPQSIIDKEPSAELAFNQKDSDTLPRYAYLDAILKLYIEGDLLSDETRQKLQNKIHSISEAEVSRVKQMVDRSEFKRKQAPPIIRVQSRSFGIGRQMPVAHHFS